MTLTGSFSSFVNCTAPSSPWTATVSADSGRFLTGKADLNAASDVATNATLTWSATNATSYDVKFGTTNPPPQVVTGQTSTDN